MELCLSKCYFLYENNIRLYQNSGPIGLSLGSAIKMLFAKNGMSGNNESLELKNFPKNIQTLCRWQPRTFSRKVTRVEKNGVT